LISVAVLASLGQAGRGGGRGSGSSSPVGRPTGASVPVRPWSSRGDRRALGRTGPTRAVTCSSCRG